MLSMLPFHPLFNRSPYFSKHSIFFSHDAAMISAAVEVYMAFALFCVLNVMTGVFVENASKMTSADEAMGRKLVGDVMGMACFMSYVSEL